MQERKRTRVVVDVVIFPSSSFVVPRSAGARRPSNQPTNAKKKKKKKKKAHKGDTSGDSLHKQVIYFRRLLWPLSLFSRLYM